MRNKRITKKQLIVIWICIYIFILLFSIAATAILIGHRNQDLTHIAQADLDHYQETGEFAPLAIKNDINNLFYDADFNLIEQHIAFDADKHFDFDAYAQKIYPKVMEKGMHSSIIVDLDLENKVGIVIAYPYQENGIFLFMKEMHTLNNIMIVLFPSITLLVIICAIFTGILQKKNNDFERMQREYVDNISHELKSPLASVRALTTAMYDGLVKDENKQKHYCSIMLGEVNNLERTVSDMLELSRIQNHQVDCDKSIYTAYDVFGAVIDKRLALCEDLNIELRMSPQLEEYPFIYTNKVLASRILDILLDNAIKFTPIEGHVHIIMTYNQKHVTISVRDSGPGIPVEDKPYIFKRFYKADKAHNEKGSGLGLAIAKEIADSLGEKLWLASTRPEGAEFSFTIQKS